MPSNKEKAHFPSSADILQQVAQLKQAALSEKSQEVLIEELSKMARMLIRRDMELADVRRKQEEQIQELDRITKQLVRRDLELTTANEKLQELDRMKSEFVSIAAHQLRTPLSAIKWALHLLFDEDVGEMTPEQKTLVRKTLKRNEQIITLVNDLLSLDQIDTGRLHYHREECQVEDLVGEIVTNSQSLLEKKELTLLYTPPATLPPTYCDTEKIQMALQNLLDNAIKYAFPKSTIAVSVQQEKDMAVVRITNTGIGIPPEDQSSIFSRFFRAANAQKAAEGSGLGLYIVKKIIEKHRGKIWFLSEPEKETTFFVSLPIKVSEVNRPAILQG